MDKYLKKIKSGLSKVHKTNENLKRSGWTAKFFDSLVDLGNETFDIYTSHCSEQYKRNGRVAGGEWLVDLCWVPKGKWNINNKGLYLVCESEWARDIEDIMYDLLKIAVIKARIKLMIIL